MPRETPFDFLGEPGAPFAQVAGIAGEFRRMVSPHVAFSGDDDALRVQRSPDGICELHSRARGAFGYAHRARCGVWPFLSSVGVPQTR